MKKKILLVARQGERERGADDEEGFVCGRGGSLGRALNAPEICTCCLRRDDGGVGWRGRGPREAVVLALRIGPYS